LRGANQVVHTESGWVKGMAVKVSARSERPKRKGRRDVRSEFGSLDKLEVLIVADTSSLVVLHLLGDVVEEAAPLGRRTELGDVVVGHVDALVGDHDHT
jgi:hypothetical protein